MVGKKVKTLAKADRPETLSQAKTWQVTMNHAVAYGLCHVCAAQLAYGHQIGFGRLEHEPCAKCLELVAQLPQQSAHPAWRKVRGTAADQDSWPAVEPRSGVPGSSGYQNAPESQSGAQNG